MKIKQLLFISLLAVLVVGLLGCGKEDKSGEDDTLFFTGVIEEVSEDTLLIRTSEDVGFDLARVDFSKDMKLTFDPVVGQVVAVECLPEIRESHPVQITAVAIEPAKAKVNKISGETAMEMMASEDPFILVDVRTQAEFDEGHIEGAMLLPGDELETLAPDKLTDKNAVILVYCRSGNRSAAASQLLIDLGYTQVYDFGGIIDWPGEVVI